MKIRTRFAIGNNPAPSNNVAERGEVRARAWLIGVAAVLGPPLLLMLFYKVTFAGLVNSDSMDFAQLGRNIAEGRGFSTHILRPLAWNAENPLHQPDVTHGPLYPFLLAVAFGAFGARDAVVALVSAAFYLLTIPVLFCLAGSLFNRRVAVLATLAYTINVLLLEYATSGLHITLYVFLATLLFLVVFGLIRAAQSQDEAPNRPMPKGRLAVAGLLSGLLYLADPIFAWVLPVIIGSVWSMRFRNPVRALAWYTVPLMLLIGPWMLRNGMITGNPVFGLRGHELWMHTKAIYPGLSAYRMLPGEISLSMPLLVAVMQKIVIGAGQLVQSFPQISASWILAFLLPCLLFRFSDASANSLRRVMMLCFGSLFVGSLLFTVWLPLFVALMPIMLVFSIAYLLHVFQEAQLSTGQLRVIGVSAAIILTLPIVTQLVQTEELTQTREANTARLLGRMTKTNEIVLSDQPWIVAWHSNRPSIWLPVSDARIGDLRKQSAGIRWLFLTEAIRGHSSAWRLLYNDLRQWDMARAVSQRFSGKESDPLVVTDKRVKAPLFTALSGFVSVPATRVDGKGNVHSDSAVLAAALVSAETPPRTALTLPR